MGFAPVIAAFFGLTAALGFTVVLGSAFFATAVNEGYLGAFVACFGMGLEFGV
jgi:hypothetical protein